MLGLRVNPPHPSPKAKREGMRHPRSSHLVATRPHTPEMAKGLHEFGLLAQALNPELTPDTIKSAVENESLEFAEELVKSGRATWKSELDLERVREAIGSWRTEKNVERVKKITGETKTLS